MMGQYTLPSSYFKNVKLHEQMMNPYHFHHLKPRTRMLNGIMQEQEQDHLTTIDRTYKAKPLLSSRCTTEYQNQFRTQQADN